MVNITIGIQELLENLFGKLKETDHLQNLGVRRGMVLKQIFIIDIGLVNNSFNRLTCVA
jgi:hypothetical protein